MNRHERRFARTKRSRNAIACWLDIETLAKGYTRVSVVRYRAVLWERVVREPSRLLDAIQEAKRFVDGQDFLIMKMAP